MNLDSDTAELARNIATSPRCPRFPSPACGDADCGKICLALPDDIKWCGPSRRSWNHVAETGKHGTLTVKQLVALLAIAKFKSGWGQAERSALKRLAARRWLQ